MPRTTGPFRVASDHAWVWSEFCLWRQRPGTVDIVTPAAPSQRRGEYGIMEWTLWHKLPPPVSQFVKGLTGRLT
jgi:hypothetical protein